MLIRWMASGSRCGNVKRRDESLKVREEGKEGLMKNNALNPTDYSQCNAREQKDKWKKMSNICVLWPYYIDKDREKTFPFNRIRTTVPNAMNVGPSCRLFSLSTANLEVLKRVLAEIANPGDFTSHHTAH